MCAVEYDYNFRKVTEEDRDKIIKMSEHFERDYLPRVFDAWLNIDRGGFYILEDPAADETVGCCVIKFKTKHQAWLAGMRIHPEYQSKGVGTELTRELAERAEQEGAHLAGFVTGVSNHPAQKLGEKLGFHIDSRWRVLFKEDLADMELILQNEYFNQVQSRKVTAVDKQELLRSVDADEKYRVFLPDFTILFLTVSELLNFASQSEREILRLDCGLTIIGEQSENSEGAPIFSVNLVLRHEQIDDRQLSESFGSLFNYLKERGYQGYTFCLPEQIWDVINNRVKTLFPDTRGGSVYFMIREYPSIY